MTDIREALDEFLSESFENLDRLDRDLVAIEADPADRATFRSIFRTIHTLKGSCGFFDLPKLIAIAHAGESLLVRLRDDPAGWRPEITDALLALVNAVRRDLDQFQATGTEVVENLDGLIAFLDRLPAAIDSRDRQAHAMPSLNPSPVDPCSRRASVRVDVDLLDGLMDLVGELVLTRNQVLRLSGSRRDTELSRLSHRLNLVTSSLQEGVMKARMRRSGPSGTRSPALSTTWLANAASSSGSPWRDRPPSLDRSVIEAIKDPITHLVRNAIDHGIEPPETRRARGKPESGRLSLRASHEGGIVLVEIDDDGAGIDPVRVARKALERGLITREQAGQMTPDEAIRLIFQPGFSTAESITRVSGRGVGLDVVRANIEAIGGTIEVRSHLGRGTTVVLKVPLTLAIIPVLIVLDGRGERYAIPQPNLVELIRLEGDEVLRGVESIGDAAFYRLRGELLPLVDLDRVFGDPRRDLRRLAVLHLAVLQADGRRLGLVVGDVVDTEEIVVKPLGSSIRSIPLFAGSTILGDGRVALILDVTGVARAAGVAPAPPAEPVEPTTTLDDRQAFLMLGLEGGRRLAVPLAEVARLLEVPASDIDRTSGREVVCHRGRLLTLVRLGDGPPSIPAGPLRVVVCDGPAGRSIGLVVNAILDVVEADPVVEPVAATSGVIGSAVFQGHSADLVDVPALIGSLAGDL